MKRTRPTSARTSSPPPSTGSSSSACVGKGSLEQMALHRPEPAADDEILLVHTPEWVRKLKSSDLSAHEPFRLEVPYPAFGAGFGRAS